MEANYKGMRWLKCDLQMQTPADAQHWEGAGLVQGKEEEAAQRFAEACHQAGLDLVGITDHNFLSKDFIPYLRKAFKEIERKQGHRITLFPGFEFTSTGVGKGVHILCLFEPETDLDEIGTVLVECGVSFPKNKAGGLATSERSLKEILGIVQDKHSGLVIMPHALSNEGLFDKDSISDIAQKEEFTNPNLLAIEVPKSPRLMSKGFQKLFRAGEDCHDGWRRERPIATLMSSDNKKLLDTDEEGRPRPNSIGYRYSWIKMSEPSIEALRQACLDHHSRVVLPEDVLTDTHPSERDPHSAISHISIQGASFLADQEVHFSSNMNCVIGGRGSGKSTLLEYLRIVLGKDEDESLDTDTKERIARIRGTIKKSTALEIRWTSQDGADERVILRGGERTLPDREFSDDEHGLSDLEMLDDSESQGSASLNLRVFLDNLPVQFYSQQQLSRLTETGSSAEIAGNERQARRLLELISGFTGSRLNELNTQEGRIQLQIQEAVVNYQKARTLRSELARLEQERRELDRQWKARSDIQGAAKRHQQLKTESRYLDGLSEGANEELKNIRAWARRIVASHDDFMEDTSPHKDWIQKFGSDVKKAKQGLISDIEKAIQKYEDTIAKYKSDDWQNIQHALGRADAEFEEACTSKGLTPSDVGRLQEIDTARNQKRQDIAATRAEIKRLDEAVGDPRKLFDEMHQIWREQFQMREEAARQANTRAVLDEESTDSGARRFIEISAKYQQDRESFRQHWDNFAPHDGRTRLGKNWHSIGDVLYNLFTKEGEAASPWEVLRALLFHTDDNGKDVFGEELAQALLQHTNEHLERWIGLRCSRVQDVVDMKLFREDGTVAGSIAEGSLSDGQRNTAALALLLTQEGGPLVIDQPEDELDSNFVFKELVPMLRKVKPRRQLIIATHNANLPVNGDAELVLALEARDGKGQALACGGLDQNSVTKAILDIMEGTEEAFQRRREKYHF